MATSAVRPVHLRTIVWRRATSSPPQLVNATPDFIQHTGVIDAASDVLVEVFGDAGRHTRLVVGVSSLPANMVLGGRPTSTAGPDRPGT